LREEHTLQVSENKIRKIFGPMWDDVTEQFRILHNKELCDFYRSASITGAVVAQ
jgi:hypothetical protein